MVNDPISYEEWHINRDKMAEKERQKKLLQEMMEADEKHGIYMNYRTAALDWWIKLSDKEKRNVVEKWKSETKDSRNYWPFELISRSTSTIELIWREEHT